MPADQFPARKGRDPGCSARPRVDDVYPQDGRWRMFHHDPISATLSSARQVLR